VTLVVCKTASATQGETRTMNNRAVRLFDRVARHALTQSPTLRREYGDSFDLMEISFLKAAYDSAEHYEKYFLTSKAFDSDLNLMSAAVSRADPNGLFLEFGVASGRTITHLASHIKTPIYGFDSFEGLPEDWRTGFGKGFFSGSLPPVPANVSLIKGWFNETLPVFLSQHEGNVSFLHVDCDLYSSTKCIFDLLGDRISKGTIIQFDEYWNYPAWKQHEYRAFEELKSARHISCKPIGFVPTHQQVAFIVE
jgi:hypothetical protein